MSAYQTDSRIDDYIATLPGWQQELCRQVRELVHAADPEVSETIKRTRQPYFTLQGNICALLGAKDHLTIFIYDPIVPDPEGLINQGHGNRTARAIQVRQGETINQRALLTLFRAIIANNRVGGWRKLKGSRVSILLALRCSRRVSGFSSAMSYKRTEFPRSLTPRKRIKVTLQTARLTRPRK